MVRYPEMVILACGAFAFFGALPCEPCRAEPVVAASPSASPPLLDSALPVDGSKIKPKSIKPREARLHNDRRFVFVQRRVVCYDFFGVEFGCSARPIRPEIIAGVAY